MQSAVRRFVRALNLAAVVSFLVVAAAVLSVLQASAGAPPPADPRPVSFEDPPGAVVADSIHNLRASEYTVDIRVEDTGDRGLADTGIRYRTDGRATTLVEHLEIDNRARRYSAMVALPSMANASAQDAASRYYSESPLKGFVRHNGKGWKGNYQLAYRQFRNAFDYSRKLSDANGTVVADNATTYVARITDTSVAMQTAYPGTPALYWTRMPPTANAAANLTVVVDKRTETIQSARFQYYHHEAERYIVTTYRFSDHGRTDVERPLLTNPPGSHSLFYRLDLGLWAFGPLDWLRAIAYVGMVGVILGSRSPWIRRRWPW